ncbi:MAG: helix-turn-helix domain-containing protein [Planctomycetes bacterium]|nr:helix-turn-helix domain-containing protein [Planctomycetota bacterium]
MQQKRTGTRRRRRQGSVPAEQVQETGHPIVALRSAALDVARAMEVVAEYNGATERIAPHVLHTLRAAAIRLHEAAQYAQPLQDGWKAPDGERVSSPVDWLATHSVWLVELAGRKPAAQVRDAIRRWRANLDQERFWETVEDGIAGMRADLTGEGIAQRVLAGLENRLDSRVPSSVDPRAQAFAMLLTGSSVAHAAAAVGVARRTVERWRADAVRRVGADQRPPPPRGHKKKDGRVEAYVYPQMPEIKK